MIPVATGDGTRKRRPLAEGWIALTVCFLLAAPAEAQLSAGFTAARFQFNLSNPGARSLGMGGAFAGLADDATAAYANPAGLTILTRPEVSFEGRSGRLSVPLVSAEPIVESIFRENGPGTIQRVVEGASALKPIGLPDATSTTASFASFVAPVGDWTLALYRHQLVDLEAPRNTLTLAPFSQGIKFDDGTGLTPTFSGVASGEALLDVSGFGLAVARRFSEQLSVGMTVVHNRAEIVAKRDTLFMMSDEGPCGNCPFGRERTVAGDRRSDDSELTFNLGLLLRPVPRVAIGAVFRQGPTLRVEETEEYHLKDCETLSSEPEPVGVCLEDHGLFDLSNPAGDFRVPDVLAVGASFRPTQELLVALEWDRVRYSRLRGLSRAPRIASFGLFNARDLDSLGSFEVEDGDELRAGLEYSFWHLPGVPALRLGAWFESDHQVRFEPSAQCPRDPASDNGEFRCRQQHEGPRDHDDFDRQLEEVTRAVAAAALERLFPPGEDRLHITAGFGVVLGSRYQLDAAFDYVDSDEYTLSLSGVVRLDRRGRKAPKGPDRTLPAPPTSKPESVELPGEPRLVPAPVETEPEPPLPALEDVAPEILEEEPLEELAPEPLPVEPPPPSVESQIEQTLEAWRRAWSERRVEDFLSFYAPDFRPDGKRSHEQWRRERERRILGKEHIEVRIENLEIRRMREGEARVDFLQVYRSDTYCDRVQKTLVLQRFDDGWKIVYSDAVPISRDECR